MACMQGYNSSPAGPLDYDWSFGHLRYSLKLRMSPNVPASRAPNVPASRATYWSGSVRLRNLRGPPIRLIHENDVSHDYANQSVRKTQRTYRHYSPNKSRVRTEFQKRRVYCFIRENLSAYSPHHNKNEQADNACRDKTERGAEPENGAPVVSAPNL